MITRARSLLCFAFLALLIPAPAQAGRVKAFDAPMSGAQIFDYDTESKQVTSLIPKLIGVDPSNVVGEWYGGYSSAGDLLDLSGHGRDLADAGTAPTATQSSLVGPDGNQLQAFSYDGSSGRHQLAHASWMNTFDQDCAVSVLVKSPPSAPGATKVFFSHGVSLTSGIYIYIENGGNFGCHLEKSGAAKAATSSSTYLDGQYHLVQAIRSSGWLTLYVDGMPGTPQDVSDGYGVDGDATMSVGSFAGTANFYTQAVAYTRLQNSALTYAQVQKEVSLWQGLAPGIGGNRLGSPTFIRSTTSYAERSTGSTPLVQVPANWPAKTSDGGVLIEGAVTQLLSYTTTFGTNWTKFNSSIAATAVTLPDGTSGTTNVLHEDGTAGVLHRINHAYGATSGTAYCQSIYMKYNSSPGGGTPTPREWVQLKLTDGVATKSVYFNIRYGYTGTVAGALTGGYGIKPVGNGWFRAHLWATAANTASGTYYVYAASADGVETFDGKDQDSVFISMPQLQTGAFPTTYHPNPTTGASRSADSLTYIPWRISKDLASKVNATPKLLFLGSESLTGTTVAPTTGSYSFSKNGRPQNDDTYAEGASFRFNGTTDWLSLPDASGGSDFDFSAAGKKFSVTVTYTPLTVAAGNQVVVGKWSSTANKRQWMIYQSTTSMNFSVSKIGTAGGTDLAVGTCIEVGKPILVTATYDGTNGDGASEMRLYVDAATAASPDYLASSSIAVAPIYNSDTELKVGSYDVSYLTGKVHYAAVYDGTVTTLAEHQAMYTAWKIDGIIPLTMSSTTAKTKLVIEYDAKAQFSSATDIGGSKHQFTISGSTGAASGTKNAVVVYAALNGPLAYYMYDSTGGTVRSMSSGVSDVAWNKWNTFKFTIDLTELANSTMTVNSVSEKDSTSNFTGAREVYLGDSLIRIGALTNPAAHSEIRNVKVSAE